MKVFTIYNTGSTLNTYLIGPEKGNEAIIIDPGMIDLHLLDLLEINNYLIKSILVTHAHERHIQGIKTLMKIFDADIYSKCPFLFNFKTIPAIEKIKLNLSGEEISVYEIPGHSEESVVYRIRDIFFTGDSLSAGLVGTVRSNNLKKLLQESIAAKILSADDNCIIMPGHGPPSTVLAEKNFNPFLNSY